MVQNRDAVPANFRVSQEHSCANGALSLAIWFLEALARTFDASCVSSRLNGLSCQRHFALAVLAALAGVDLVSRWRLARLSDGQPGLTPTANLCCGVKMIKSTARLATVFRRLEPMANAKRLIKSALFQLATVGKISDRLFELPLDSPSAERASPARFRFGRTERTSFSRGSSGGRVPGKKISSLKAGISLWAEIAGDDFSFDEYFLG